MVYLVFAITLYLLPPREGDEQERRNAGTQTQERRWRRQSQLR